MSVELGVDFNHTLLSNTPVQTPYWEEVSKAAGHWERGETSSDIVYSILHGKVSALYKAGELDEKDWTVKEVVGGVIIAHREFLAIQDEFAELEGLEADQDVWNSERTLQAFENYVSICMRSRQDHGYLFFQVYQKLDKEDKCFINEQLGEVMENNIRFQNENEFIVVAVPYRTDAPELWDRLGVPKDVSVATFAKIEERGVVFASRIFRDDERDGEGHDYFSYSHKLVKDGIVKDIEEGLTRGAKHEGSHYLIDALVCHLLDIGDANPAYESVAELVSNGQRIHVSTSVPFDVIIEDPYMEKHDFTRLSANYHAAPKVLLSLVNITAQENKIDYEVALVSVMAAALRTAIEMNASETLNFMNSNQRVSSFFRGLASELNISYEQLQTEYQAVNGSGEESV